VPGHLHGDALGNAGAHQVTYCGSSQIVRNATRTARLRTRRPERLDEGRDPLALHLAVRSVEHPRADDALGFQPVVLALLRLQELVERVGEGNTAPVSVFPPSRDAAERAGRAAALFS
jgi:hypothetical protein